MTLPECVMRLLPEDLPLDAVTSKSQWILTAKGIPLDPIFKTRTDEVAICDTEEQILPSMQLPGTRDRVWYSVHRIDTALKLARRLGIDRIFFTQTESNGKPTAPLAIIGHNSKVALVVAPNLEPDDEEDDDERGRDI